MNDSSAPRDEKEELEDFCYEVPTLDMKEYSVI